MIRLVIDTDPGIDDALALFMVLAAARERVAAITTVAGNVPLADTTRNACAVLDAAGAGDIPVYPGAEASLLGSHHGADRYHGADGLGGVRPARIDATPRDEHGVLALVRLAHAHAGALDILALGPLTNVALAVALEPALPRLVRRLIWMGGTIAGQGNITPAAEFNAWCDPEAVHRVLGAGFALTLVSWETTLAHLVPWAAWEEWLAGDGPRARFARAFMERAEARDRARGFAGMPIPDPLAAAVALDDAVVQEAVDRPVDAVLTGNARGQTIVDARRGVEGVANARIVMRLDMERVGRFVRNSLDAR